VKITKAQIRKIIKEEVLNELGELGRPQPGSPRAGRYYKNALKDLGYQLQRMVDSGEVAVDDILQVVNGIKV
jgi:hypothetical protein